MGKPKDRHKKRKWRHKRYVLQIIKQIQKYKKLNKNKSNHGKGSGKTSLILPQILDLDKNYNETIVFFNKLRELSYNIGRKDYLDFTKIKHITPETALILVSEIYMYKENKRINLAIRDFNRWDNNIKIQFFEMGMFDLLKIKNLPKNFGSQYNNDKIKYVKFRVSYVSDEEVMQFQEDVKKMINIPNHEYLHDSITEAIINVRKHAYTKKLKYKPKKPYWWAIGSYNTENKMLSVLVFDHGVGIPSTLEKNYPELYKKRFLGIEFNKKPKDSDIIKVAMEPGKTSTNQKNRGRGSQDIKEYIAKTQNSMLRIRSLKGIYEYKTNGKEYMDDKDKSLQGTLLVWNVSMEKNYE